jgi:hypothetical protein
VKFLSWNEKSNFGLKNKNGVEKMKNGSTWKNEKQ